MKLFKARIFTLITIIAIAAQLLAACSPRPTPTQEPLRA
jgi:hypothetical protein